MALALSSVPVAAVPDSLLRQKFDADTDSESTTPTTQGGEFETDSETSEFVEESASALGPGLYHDDVKAEDMPPSRQPSNSTVSADASACSESSASSSNNFSKEATLFVLDWDDTLLPSTWIRSQGLRLDDNSKVSTWQHEQLATVAPLVIETLQLAKQCGTVVLVTAAERGWIELSCRKFLPSVMPILENLRIVSARTAYEGFRNPSPFDWKMRAFETEIARVYGVGALDDDSTRKNILSFGDGAHEREAVLRTTAGARSCRTKSLKFVDHPSLGQLIQQHELIIGSFDNIVQHDADMDLLLNCP